jgi:hypothetical protein
LGWVGLGWVGLGWRRRGKRSLRSVESPRAPGRQRRGGSAPKEDSAAESAKRAARRSVGPQDGTRRVERVKVHRRDHV